MYRAEYNLNYWKDILRLFWPSANNMDTIS